MPNWLPGKGPIGPRPARPKRRKRAPTEHSAQARLVAHVRHFHQGVLIAAVPNGGRRDKREAARLKSEGVLEGYPDLLIDEPRGAWHGMRIEMKREGGGVESAKQEERRRHLLRRGYLSVVCHGAEEAIQAVEAYLSLPRPPDFPL